MRGMFLTAIVIILLALLGAAPARAQSQAQRAYDACTDSHNSEYRFKKNYKAIVSGVANGKTSCFWVWGKKSVGEARRAAIANCERKYGSCFVYADSSGLESWVARISNMGGNDGTKFAGSGGGGDGGAAMGAFLGGFLGGVMNGVGNGGSGGGGGSACTAAQRARGWSEERCIRN